MRALYYCAQFDFPQHLRGNIAVRTQPNNKIQLPAAITGRRIIVAIALASTVSCASVPSGQPESAVSSEELWLEVPETTPSSPPENQPESSNSTKLATKDIPAIEPLRQPIEVNETQNSIFSFPTKPAGSIAVTEMTDASAENGESEIARVSSSVVPSNLENQGVTQTTNENTTQSVAASIKTPETILVTSDIEIMCTEVEAGKSIGSEGCAILDGSVAGLGYVPNSSELTDSAQQVLDSVVIAMKKKKDLRLSVTTYSNDLDDSELGKLSQRRRTLAVIRHLIDAGIEGSRVRPNAAPLPTEIDSQADISQYLVVLRNVDQ